MRGLRTSHRRARQCGRGVVHWLRSTPGAGRGFQGGPSQIVSEGDRGEPCDGDRNITMSRIDRPHARCGPVRTHPHIPKKAFRRFQEQRAAADRRGVAWELTPDEWWAWWCQDNRWEHRGRRKDGLVMSRHGDKGPYRLDNIYCSTLSRNMQETGMSVVTPKGRFPTAALAAIAFKVKAKTACDYASKGKYGWSYER